MTPSFITESSNDAVHTITLSRPELHNAFNEIVIEELAHTLVEAGKRDDVRVVILAAESKSFGAGAALHGNGLTMEMTECLNSQPN